MKKLTKRQFVLNTLLPYKENPETCAVNKERKMCMYLTEDGRKCAVGKHMKEGVWQDAFGDYEDITKLYKQSEFLTDEALEQKLTTEQWTEIQRYHDNLAINGNFYFVNRQVDRLEKLFNCKFTKLRL